AVHQRGPRAALLARLGRFDEAWPLAEAGSSHLREVTGDTSREAYGDLALIAAIEGDRERACRYRAEEIERIAHLAIPTATAHSPPPPRGRRARMRTSPPCPSPQDGSTRRAKHSSDPSRSGSGRAACPTRAVSVSRSTRSRARRSDERGATAAPSGGVRVRVPPPALGQRRVLETPSMRRVVGSMVTLS